MGRIGGRKLIAGVVAWAAVASLAVVASASPAGAVPSRSPIQFWGPNVSYTGVAGDAKKVHAMEKLGNVLFVGGNFDTIAPEPATVNNNGVAGVAQPHLYAVDATTGTYLPQFAPQLNGPVFALELDPATGTLYVGGTFTAVNGQSVTGLAALDTTTGALKGTQRSLANTGGAPGAYALHLVGRQLYVGGQFTNVGGVAKGQIAKVSVDAGNAVDPAFQSYLREGKVLSLSNDGTKLIVAGEFDALQTGPGGTDVAGTRFLGAVALDTGATVTTFIPNVPCPGTCNAETRGRSVTVANGIVFAAFGGNWGRFGAYRATDAAQLAMWDVSGDAQAVATSGNTVFVGGHFEAITNLPGDPARCHAFSATFGTVDAINLQLQPEPNIYNGGHVGVFSIVAPAADDTYWAGHLTRFDQPVSGDECGDGLQIAPYSHIMRVVEGGGPADTAVPSTPSNVVAHRRQHRLDRRHVDRLHRRHRRDRLLRVRERRRSQDAAGLGDQRHPHRRRRCPRRRDQPRVDQDPGPRPLREVLREVGQRRAPRLADDHDHHDDDNDDDPDNDRTDDHDDRTDDQHDDATDRSHPDPGRRVHADPGALPHPRHPRRHRWPAAAAATWPNPHPERARPRWGAHHRRGHGRHERHRDQPLGPRLPDRVPER